MNETQLRLLDEVIKERGKTRCANWLEVSRPTLDKLLSEAVDYSTFERIAFKLDSLQSDLKHKTLSVPGINSSKTLLRPWDRAAAEFDDDASTATTLLRDFHAASQLDGKQLLLEESIGLANYFLLIAEYSYLGKQLQPIRLDAIARGIAIVAPISAIREDQYGIDAAMIYGQLLQNLEGKFWNPIAFPRLKRTEGEYVLAKLKEAELLFSSIQTRFGSRFTKSASRSEHIQLVCQARTFGQLGNIKKAEETIELACDRLGQKTFHSLVTLGSALGLQRKVLEATKMLEDARDIAIKDKNKEHEQMSESMIFALTGTQEYQDSARRTLASNGMQRKYAFIVDFNLIRKRLNSKT